MALQAEKPARIERRKLKARENACRNNAGPKVAADGKPSRCCRRNAEERPPDEGTRGERREAWPRQAGQTRPDASPRNPSLTGSRMRKRRRSRNRRHDGNQESPPSARRQRPMIAPPQVRAPAKAARTKPGKLTEEAQENGRGTEGAPFRRAARSRADVLPRSPRHQAGNQCQCEDRCRHTRSALMGVRTQCLLRSSTSCLKYRGYVYAYVDDEYVICDPDTYEIVAVLPEQAGSGGSAQRQATSTCSRRHRAERGRPR